MSAGMVIGVRTLESSSGGPAGVEVVDGSDLEAQYNRLITLVIRMGDWLAGPRGQLLPQETWEAMFARYQEHLEQLRRLGDELRPVFLRDRSGYLTGDAMVTEVVELFAA